MEQEITFNIEKWSLKIENRKRNRMKLIFKLNKEETEGFTAFEKTIKPKDVSQTDFVKTLFFKGVEALNIQFTEMAQQIATEEAEKEKLAKEKEEATKGPTVLKKEEEVSKPVMGPTLLIDEEDKDKATEEVVSKE